MFEDHQSLNIYLFVYSFIHLVVVSTLRPDQMITLHCRAFPAS